MKSVELVALADGAADRFGVTARLTVNARAVGPRLGKRVQDVIRAAKAGEWSQAPQGGVVVRTVDGEVALYEGEFEPKGFIALVDGKAVGLTHYLYHRSGWSKANNCYLQDLFADPDARGKGVGAALIEAVRQAAAKIGVTNVYWMTHETNATARRLYDRVARRTGFLEYDLL